MLSQKSRIGPDPKPYLRNANVQWEKANLTEVYRMDFSEREQAKFRLRDGDLLVCEGGEIGRTAIWRNEIDECYFQKAIHRLRPRSTDVSPTFFLFWMEWAFRFADVYGVTGTQTTIAHLPQEKLEELWIPHPTKAEQDKIAAVLNASSLKIAALEREMLLLDQLFAVLLDELWQAESLHPVWKWKLHDERTFSGQNPMLKYAREIGWEYVKPDDALGIRGGDTGLYFNGILEAQLIRLNPGVMDLSRTQDCPTSA